jgi:hypothetical protein
MASFSNVGQYSGYSTRVLRWKRGMCTYVLYIFIVNNVRKLVSGGCSAPDPPERGSRRPCTLPLDGDIAKTQDDAAAGCEASETHLRAEP